VGAGGVLKRQKGGQGMGLGLRGAAASSVPCCSRASW
jgi:hypothetical protein